MLGIGDSLGYRPRRIVVAGVSGAGKTFTARRIALSGIPHIEIDALFHGPHWTPRPTFLAEVDEFSRTDSWVTEWQYSSAREVLAARADTLVWLDYPTRVVLYRVVRRTVRRARAREVLWNGNVEPGLWHAITHQEGIIRWAWRTRGKYRESVPKLEVHQPKLVVVRLRNQRETDRWIAATFA